MTVDYSEEVTEEQVRKMDETVRKEFETGNWVTVEQEAQSVVVSPTLKGPSELHQRRFRTCRPPLAAQRRLVGHQLRHADAQARAVPINLYRGAAA